MGITHDAKNELENTWRLMLVRIFVLAGLTIVMRSPDAKWNEFHQTLVVPASSRHHVHSNLLVKALDEDIGRITSHLVEILET